MRVGAAVSVHAGTRVHDVEMRMAAAGTAARRCSRPIPADGAAPRPRAIHRMHRSGRGTRIAGHRACRPARSCPPPRTRRPLPARARRHRAPDATRVHGGCVRTRLIRLSAGIIDGFASASAATTSIVEISGAAARTASSTANSSVTDDDGQLLQLPANCRRTDFAVDLEQMDVAAMRAEVGPHTVECVLDPPLDAVRVLHRAPTAGWQPGRRQRTRPRVRAAPRQPCPSCVAGLHRRGRLLHGPTAPRVRARRRHPIALASRRFCIRSPAVRHCASCSGLSGRCGICHSPVTDWVGECNLSSVFPLPRYMCTPQGRHGSKLRTVRMMSMPLKFSRLFSSKIG